MIIPFLRLIFVNVFRFIHAVEDVLFRQKTPSLTSSTRNPTAVSPSYRKEEILVDIIDEFFAEFDCRGHIEHAKVHWDPFQLF